MISSELFFNLLKKKKISFYTGVPDSLLKNFCLCVDENVDKNNHIITPNEGIAIALAGGHHLATGKVPLVYMQNSGLGNAVNPLTSFADEEVYGVPMLLVVGFRGEPGTSDEPQHKKMGKITTDLLDILNIPYTILSNNWEQVETEIGAILEKIKNKQSPHALVIKKGTFNPRNIPETDEIKYTLTREQALESVLPLLTDEDIVVSTTGKLSRELFELREKRKEGHERDFLTVGSMGYASQIALGIANEKKDRKVYCFDGDGAILMHLGGMTTVGDMKPSNYVHILFNNGRHDSVGGQKTVGFSVDFCTIARAVGYNSAIMIDSKKSLQEGIVNTKSMTGPHFIEIRIKDGSRDNLGRPTISPKQNKAQFMKFLDN